MEKWKKRIWIEIVVVVLIVVGTSLLTYFIMKDENNIVKNIINKSVVTENQKEKNKIIHDTAKAEKTIDAFLFLDEDKHYSGNMDINDLDTHDLISLSFNNIDRDYVGSCSLEDGKKLALKDINDVLTKYVNGRKLTLDDLKTHLESEIKVNHPGIYFHYKIGDDDSISIDVCGGWIGPDPDVAVYKTIKHETNEDIMKVYRKVAFKKFKEHIQTYDENQEFYRDIFIYDYYLTPKRDGKPEISETQMMGHDRFNTYVYTLKLINDNYYLKNINLVK